jgi:predicted ATPase
MPFLTEVHFQNYRSFIDAKCRLSRVTAETAVTAVIGANNAGKSNFLKSLADLNDYESPPCRTEADGGEDFENLGHRRQFGFEGNSSVKATDSVGSKLDLIQERLGEPVTHVRMGWGRLSEKWVRLYALDAKAIAIGGGAEDKPEVLPNGAGTIRVLDRLSRERPEIFQAVVEQFQEFLPEIEGLIIDHDGKGRLHASVRERGIEAPEKLRKVSPGCRTVLALLAIIHQPNRPELILLEDIEHAIHPRGLEPLIETMRRISKEHQVQFIFTTQSPYVLDCFRAKEHWADVVIVEKKDGVSRLANMDDRLKRLHYEEEMDKVRLSELWYSGLMGGVANPPPAWDKET